MARELGRLQQALLHRLADGRLRGRAAAWVHARVGSDEAWRTAYDALRRAEQAAAGAKGWSAGQRELLEELVLAGSAPPSPRRRGLGILAIAACGAAAALALLIVPPPASEELVARGAKAPAVGVRVRCLVDGEVPRVAGATLLAPGRPGRALRCPAGSLLAFALSNLTAAPAHVFLLGVRSDGELLWFSPFDRRGRSVEVDPEESHRVLEVAAETSGMDLGERVSLFALFHEEPMEPAQLERELEGARQRGLHLESLERLPLDVSAQARAEMMVQDR